MSTQQSDLGGRSPPENHLTFNAPDRGEQTTLNRDNEFWCCECGNRVTRNPNGDEEYGHEKSCSHSVYKPQGGGQNE